MIRSNNSLGTLAAVAALAATHSASANIQVSNFTNLAFPTTGNSINLDIDNNGENDFTIDVINSFEQDIFGIDPLNGIVSNAGTARPLGAGVDIWSGQGYVNNVSFYDFLPDTDGYIGLQFQRAGERHYGWIELEFTGDTGTVLRGAWEDVSWETDNNVSITTGAVPEPSTSALLGGLLAMTGTMGFKRRRKQT